MIILVPSCDKNQDLFDAFHHCIEKYYPNHPEIIYVTETIQNPYYKTICKNYAIEQWTLRIREALKEIDDEQILMIMDDYFIRQPVDEKRIEYLSKQLKDNIAMFCFEKSYDVNDEETEIIGIKKRKHGAEYEVPINCGLWDKNKLIDILKGEHNPWYVEFARDNCGYDFYINSGDYIIDWGYETWIPTGVFRGKWCRNVVPFFEKEGIEVDYSIRGFND